MLSFWPTMRFSSVDFPTLGFPTTVTIPALGIKEDTEDCELTAISDCGPIEDCEPLEDCELTTIADCERIADCGLIEECEPIEECELTARADGAFCALVSPQFAVGPHSAISPQFAVAVSSQSSVAVRKKQRAAQMN